MKKIISLLSVMTLLMVSLFALTGCEGNGGDSGKDAKKANTIETSEVFGKGKITVLVPKKEDETPKYAFSKEKPEDCKFKGSFYLETEKAVLVFTTSGLAYNTSKDYKEKFGDVKATFDGYLQWMDDPSSTIPKNNTEKLEINGRKAVKRESKEGSSGNYKYYGFNYMIAVDDIYPGSYMGMGVYYKGNEEHKSADAIDSETQAIIDSLVVTLNN
ncbi:MAG: hypothetical protein IKE01_07070 [Clostridia bacterium]|nr:hypothetical protein [Clostridia bacterium]